MPSRGLKLIGVRFYPYDGTCMGDLRKAKCIQKSLYGRTEWFYFNRGVKIIESKNGGIEKITVEKNAFDSNEYLYSRTDKWLNISVSAIVGQNGTGKDTTYCKAWDYLAYKTIKVIWTYKHYETVWDNLMHHYNEVQFKNDLKDLLRDSSHCTLKIRQTLAYLKFREETGYYLNSVNVDVDSAWAWISGKIGQNLYHGKDYHKLEKEDLLPPPFVLSDIPSSNILYLSRDKDDKLRHSTFAANIHDLFDDAFFLPNTMGTIAQRKVEELVDYYNAMRLLKEKKRGWRPLDNRTSEQKDEAMTKMQYIASIIGDSYLHDELADMVDEMKEWEKEAKRSGYEEN